jgi:hypothetical protein
MERQDSSGNRGIKRFFTKTNALRLFVVLTLGLALYAGLGWEQYAQLQKKYDDLSRRHERLNRIYLQEKKK